MIDLQTAKVRVMLSEMEERRRKEKTTIRSARWRFGVTIAITLMVLAVGIYLNKTHADIKGADIGALFLIYIVSSAWGEYRAKEELHDLRAELQHLRDEINSRAS